MRLIGLCGFIGSGKNTVANILERKGGYKQLSFASSLKDAVAAVFGWERRLLEGDTVESRVFREKVDKWWSPRLGGFVTPRSVLQQVGTELFRDGLNKDIWIYSLERKLSQAEGDIVVTDCRFPNEIQTIQSMGGVIVHVSRGQLPEWFEKYRQGDILQVDTILHPSEYSWAKNARFDFHIENDGTLEDLEKKVMEKLL
jgi:hypothetical protein